MNSTGPASEGLEHVQNDSMARRVQVPCRRLLRERRDFFYLYLGRVFGAALGHEFCRDARISGIRSIVHAALFVTFFYLGSIRKWKRHSIVTFDQDKEKIQEVVTTWIHATAEGDLETVLSLIAEDAVFLLSGQPPMRGTRSLCWRPPFRP